MTLELVWSCFNFWQSIFEKCTSVLAPMSWRLKWAFLTQICPCQHNLFTFLSSPPEQQGQFQPNWAQSIPKWLMRIQECSNMDHALSKGRGGVNNNILSKQDYIHSSAQVCYCLEMFLRSGEGCGPWACCLNCILDACFSEASNSVFYWLSTLFFYSCCFSTLVESSTFYIYTVSASKANW